MEKGVEKKSKMNDKSKRVEWSNLPKELWLEISKHLKSAIDVARFRSICRLCRNLLPLPSSYTIRRLWCSLPPLPSATHHIPHCLLQTKTYRLEPLHPLFSSSKGKGWIIKFIGDQSKPRLLNPFLPEFTFKKPTKLVLNMAEFRVVELFEEYSLNLTGENYDEGGQHHYKVVLFENHIVFALSSRLYVSEIGDKKWTQIKNYRREYFQDIILHKGSVYVLDITGTIWWIKIISRCSPLSYELVQFSPPIKFKCRLLQRLHLVECDGSLYVVATPRKYDSINTIHIDDSINIYKLDVKRDRWSYENGLGDNVCVLGRDSNYCLSARDYYGLQRNCIYFFHGDKVCGINLYNLNTNQSPRIFWPSRSLFTMREGRERSRKINYAAHDISD